MKRLFSRLSLLMVVATAVSVVSSNAAFAEVAQVAQGTGEVQGGGTISPGLTSFTAPAPQSFHFTASVTGDFAVGTNVAVGTINCTFDGSGPASPVGSGPLSGTCNGVGLLGNSVTASVTGEYTRAGAVLSVVFGGHTGGSATLCVNAQCSTGIAAAELVFFPGQTSPPVTSFTVAGLVDFF